MCPVCIKGVLFLLSDEGVLIQNGCNERELPGGRIEAHGPLEVYLERKAFTNYDSRNRSIVAFWGVAGWGNWVMSQKLTIPTKPVKTRLLGKPSCNLAGLEVSRVRWLEGYSLC
jgi:hypothetical protein